MTSKHTPGPWLIEHRTVYALSPSDVNRFSVLVQGGYDSTNRKTFDGELDANARLIAAAPDLLAMLKKMSKQLGLAFESDRYACNVYGVTALIDEADALIEKVEGK